MSEVLWLLGPFIPLVLCSIIALAVILERVLAYLKLKTAPPFPDHYSPKNVAETLEAMTTKPCFYQSALISLSQNSAVEKPLRDEATGFALGRSALKFRKNLSGLVTISALAPLFGLLGTVIGLMRAFRNIGQNQGPVEPYMIADGLWQALSTTATGLIIAAACLIAHAIFSSIMRRRLSRAKALLDCISLAQSGISSTL